MLEIYLFWKVHMLSCWILAWKFGFCTLSLGIYYLLVAFNSSVLESSVRSALGNLWVWKLEITFEPCHEIMVLFVLRKLILQTSMRSHPVELDVWCLVDTSSTSYFMCVNSEGSGETARMRRLASAFAGHLRDKYHNLLSWLICFKGRV